MKVTLFPCGPFANVSERKAVEHLKHRLISTPGDGEWVLLSNLSFSSSHRKQSAEIDIVAIGPPGVRVIEVKHWSTGWINRNQDLVEHEADKVTDKARKVGTTLRERVRSGLGRVDGVFLVTQARFKVKGLTDRSVKGVSMYALDQWREALDADAPEVLSGPEVWNLAQALDTKASVALDGSLKRFADYTDLSLQTPVAERFHRKYRAKHASRRERVVLHLYDLSAVDDGAETKARREFEALRRVQRHRWAPRIRDSYQTAPGYAGEMAFFTIDDPAAPSLAKRMSDASWTTAERLDFALHALRALVDLHTETSGSEPLVHRSLSPETVLVRHDNLPILTGFDRAKIPEHATVATVSASNGSTAAFVAPEVRTEGLAGADHRSDVYQLCASLAHLFSGRTDESSRDALKVLDDGTAEIPRDRADLPRLVRGFRELRGEQVSRPAPPPAEFWTAEQVVRFRDNDYQIVEKLGQGGIGIAYKVARLDPRTEEALGHYVAKVVLEAPTGRVVLESYRRVHAHLRHSALSTIFEVAREWQENSILALLTWIEGEPLTDYLGVLGLEAEERSEGDPQACLLDWLRELCKALDVLHRNDLVHGDVSPGNLILTDSVIVLTDYDLVTRIGRTASSPGTSLYCSPSRAEQRPVAPSDDFYALAASFFHALFGNKPFQYGGNRSKDRGLNWEGIDSAELPVIRHFLDRATDPRAEKRYSSADEALADLGVRAGRDPRQPSKPRPTPPLPPRRPPVPVQTPRPPAGGRFDYVPHRQRLVDWLRSQLIGPATRDSDTLVGIAPWERYPTGMLYPVERGVSGLDPAETSVGISAEAGQRQEDTEDEIVQKDGTEGRSLAQGARRRRYVPPSSVGFSCFVRGPARLVITVSAATYTRTGARDARGQFQKLRYVRTSIAPETLVWEDGRLDPVRDERFGVDVRRRLFRDGSVFTVTFYNRQEMEPRDFGLRQSQSLSEKSLFEARLECEVATGTLSEYPRVDPSLLSEEEQELELQYRDRKIYAVGHGSGVDWQSDGVARIRTEYIPSTNVPLVTTTLAGAGEKALGLEFLSTAARETVVPHLASFIDGYADWIANQPLDGFDEAEQAAAGRLLKRMDAAVRRMRGGVALLQSDAKVYEAFQLANRSMLDQMRQSNRIRKQEDDSSGFKWRPFQLAFLLTVLESTVQEDDPFRDVLDLIWFPTGGGKTEAYLGLTAFVIVWRRFVHGDSGAGTCVLMRYTLRLLTRQQFERSTRVIFALELLRRSEPALLGRSPISAGIWIGKATSPNTFQQAKKAADEINEGAAVPNGLVVDACPWCGADFDGRNYRATENEFRLHCVSPDCDFGRNPDLPLPCNVVDDALYAEPPSLLIGTIDKFARLPWTSRAGAFFGDGSRRAPELVIQDELHLITGPLGSVAGLYEAGLETLLQIRGVRPKYVASTATIRMAKEQVRRLYGRDLAVFPPAGLSCDDCYFARTQHDRPGRLYVGYLARMLDQRHCLAPLAAALLAAPLELFRDQAEKDALLEAWWTQVVYHSSLRAVTDSSNAYAVGVRDWIRRLAGESIASAKEATSEPSTSPASDPSGDTSRERVDNASIAQLTSLATPKDIARTFSRLERGREDSDHLDVVLSTNMVSVGLDVSRLALMVICGQPLTTAEYIQASSRVGRSDVPGLVVANYFRHQARSLAHYENFRSYHESFYRFVEPSSVTPYTQQVRHRALHAALVVALRHGCDHMRENDSAGLLDRADPRVRRAVETLKRRCRAAVVEGQAGEVDDHIERLLEQWCQEIERCRSNRRMLSFEARDRGTDGLLKGHDEPASGLWETLFSMRNVENTAALVARWQ